MTTTGRSGRTLALAAMGALFGLALLALFAFGGGRMMGSGGLGMLGGGMFVVPLLLLGLVILVVAAFASAAVSTSGSAFTLRDDHGDRGDAEPTDPALETLRQRYARGELADDEFETRRRTLEDRSDR